MKRRQFLTALILGFVMLISTDMKAQSDAFFSQQDVNNRTQQQKAISYGNVYTDQSGVGIDNFVNDTPLSGGLFALTATGLVYLIGKRRKENK